MTRLAQGPKGAGERWRKRALQSGASFPSCKDFPYLDCVVKFPLQHLTFSTTLEMLGLDTDYLKASPPSPHPTPPPKPLLWGALPFDPLLL